MRKVAFITSILILVFLFTFMKHYLELAVSVETWMLGKGLMLHKDYIAFHFPLVRLILLPFHIISNWNFKIEPFFGLATGISSLFVIYKFGEKFFIKKFSTIVALLFFTSFYWFYATGISFYHEMVIGLFIIISIYFYYSKRWFLTSLFLGLALLSGQVSFITIGTFGLILLSNRNSRKNILTIGLGFLIPIMFMLIYYADKNALYEFYRWNVLYYLTYAGYDKNLPMNQVQDLVASFIPILPLIFSFKKNWFIYLLAISTIPFNFFSVFHFHHLSYSLPILAITAGFAYEAIFKSKIVKQIFKFSLLAFGLIFIVSIFPWYKNHLISSPNFSIANDVTTGDNMDLTINWLKQNSDEKDTIMVFGDSLFYIRSNRLPSVRASAGMPYAWEPFKEVKDEIHNKPSDFWIIDEQFKNRFVKNYNKHEMVDFMDEELNSCYKLVKVFPLWQIWKRHCK